MTITLIEARGIRSIAQENDETCWLAAYQMMFLWKGRPLEPIRKILEDALGKEETDECYKSGMDIKDWPKAAAAFGMRSWPGQKMGLEVITRMIADGPILVHGRFALGMHTIVVVGTNDETDEVCYVNPKTQVWGEKPKSRWSSFSNYLLKGIIGNRGLAGVLQQW